MAKVTVDAALRRVRKIAVRKGMKHVANMITGMFIGTSPKGAENLRVDGSLTPYYCRPRFLLGHHQGMPHDWSIIRATPYTVIATLDRKTAEIVCKELNDAVAG